MKRNKQTDRLNAEALYANGEVEVYSRDYFVNQGKKAWKGKTTEEIKAILAERLKKYRNRNKL